MGVSGSLGMGNGGRGGRRGGGGRRGLGWGGGYRYRRSDLRGGRCGLRRGRVYIVYE